MVTDDQSVTGAGHFLLNILLGLGKRAPDAIMTAGGVTVILVFFVLPMRFASKSEADNVQATAIKALCNSYHNRNSFQETSTQNEIYNLEGQMYQVTRIIDHGKPLNRDFVRRDHLRIQIQQLNTHLKYLQRHEDTVQCAKEGQ